MANMKPHSDKIRQGIRKYHQMKFVWDGKKLGVLHGRQILEEQENKCAICGNGDVWMGKKLKLHFDHIDGDRKNNTRENIRAICPNCHTQTPTYCTGNIKKHCQNNRRVDEKLLLEALLKFDKISDALSSMDMAPKGSNYKTAKKLLDKHYGLLADTEMHSALTREYQGANP